MSVAAADDLVLAELAASRDDSGEERSVSELLEALGAASERLSGGIELATALEDLRAAGLVARSSAGERDHPAFVLTDAGEARAAEVRERIADTRIELVDGDARRRLRLCEAARELDRSLVSVATDCTDDGVYYREDDPVPEGVVGRDRERERCLDALQEVRDTGDGRAVFLTGPGGIGKTTLAEDLLAAADANGFDAVAVRCRDDGDPFQPLRDALDAVDSSPSPFSALGPAVDDPETFRAQQRGLFHEVTDRLAPADGDPPRLVFLDDCHLADAGTMAYLEYLLGRLADRPLAILGTYRRSGLPEGAPLEGGSDAVRHVRLDPLDESATRALVERVLERRGVPADLAAAIHERTGGNPLFVEETVSRLLETDQLDPAFEWYPETADEIDVPEAVRETIDRRVDALDDDARALLRWAAVFGDHAPVAPLRAVCDLAESRFDTLLEALVTGDVFDRTGDSAEIAFRSNVVREALLEELSPAERREHHDAVAEALEGVPERSGEADDGSGERTAAIAAHHERAGNDDAAIAHYRRAAERAIDVYAHEAAIEHYHAALALARDGDDEATVLAIAEELAGIYFATSEFDRAHRYVRFVRERADDPARRQRVAVLAGGIANARGEYEDALERVAEGLAVDGGTSRERCRLLGRKARAERERSEFDRAAATAERQRELAVEVADPALEARALRQLAAADMARGNVASARDHLETGLRAAETADDRHERADVRKSLGMAAYQTGDFDAAREHYRAAIETFRRVGDRHAAATTRMNLGVALEMASEYEAARDRYREALEAFRAVGDRHTAAGCRLNLGILARKRGAYDTAEDHLQAALETFEDVGDRYRAASARHVLGTLAVDRGEYEASGERLRTALADAESIGAPRTVATARKDLGRLALARGEYDAAREHLRAALEESRAIDADHFALEARVCLGRLALETGARETAAERLQGALDAAAELDAPLDAARIRGALGELALQRGDEGASERHLREALERLEGIGARDEAARTRSLLGELAIERGDEGAAERRLREALETLEEIGAVPDALETIERLVRASRERGDEEGAREWCRRAEDLLETADDALAATYADAFADHRRALSRTDRESADE